MPCQQTMSGRFNDALSQETTGVSSRFIGLLDPLRPALERVSGARLELTAKLEPLPQVPDSGCLVSSR